MAKNSKDKEEKYKEKLKKLQKELPALRKEAMRREKEANGAWDAYYRVEDTADNLQFKLGEKK